VVGVIAIFGVVGGVLVVACLGEEPLGKRTLVVDSVGVSTSLT